MAVRELIKPREFSACSVVVAPSVVVIAACEVVVVAACAVVIPAHGVVIAGVFMTVEAVLLPHEGVRVFPYFLANSLVLLQVRLQRRVLLVKFFVVYQRGVLAKLLGDFAMAV